MSTVGKAISLLNAFTVRRPQLGLTELAGLCNLDKATTRRLLVALQHEGLIDQDAASRKYRLGPALPRLARIRDATFPLAETARPLASGLSEETGETVHVSEFEIDTLRSVLVIECAAANRVSLRIGERLPLHATASGLAYLAASQDSEVERLTAGALTAYTAFTIVDSAALRDSIAATRRRGYSLGNQGHSEGVFSVSAAILDASGAPIGALAIATPLARIDDAKREYHGQRIRDVATRISSSLSGGNPSSRWPADQETAT